MVSPTSVAAPCRFDDTAMAMIMPTGLIFCFLAMARAMGAIISTVATLSMKADTNPANSESMMTAHLTLGTFSRSRSASSCGIFDSISSATVPMVPAIISSTLKSMAGSTFETGSIPETTKITAEPMATAGRHLGSASIRI